MNYPEIPREWRIAGEYGGCENNKFEDKS